MSETLRAKIKALTSSGALLSKTFVWAPFLAGISIFAVVLPKPRKITTTKGVT